MLQFFFLRWARQTFFHNGLPLKTVSHMHWIWIYAICCCESKMLVSTVTTRSNFNVLSEESLAQGHNSHTWIRKGDLLNASPWSPLLCHEKHTACLGGTSGPCNIELQILINIVPCIPFCVCTLSVFCDNGTFNICKHIPWTLQYCIIINQTEWFHGSYCQGQSCHWW